MEKLSLDNVIPWLISLLPNILGAVITLIIGFIIANAVAKIVKKLLSKGSMDETIVSFSGSLISVGIKVMTFLAALAFFGIQTASSYLPILIALAFVAFTSYIGGLLSKRNSGRPSV